jgi:hypothetical protein
VTRDRVTGFPLAGDVVLAAGAVQVDVVQDTGDAACPGGAFGGRAGRVAACRCGQPEIMCTKS